MNAFAHFITGFAVVLLIIASVEDNKRIHLLQLRIENLEVHDVARGPIK